MEVITSNYRTDNCGDWPFEPIELMRDLTSGKESLDSKHLQGAIMDWMQCKEYNHFKNQENGIDSFALVCKRRNVVYATRKSVKMDEMIECLNNYEFDYPIGTSGKLRMTRLLFLTLTFDEDKSTKEEAWYSLRSASADGVNNEFGFINNLDANLSKIFGKHGKLVCKEAQVNGYPAPHLLFDIGRTCTHQTSQRSKWQFLENG